MASTQEATGTERGTLQELARRHLWMHFTRMSAYDDHEIPIIVRGEGCYVYDEHGKRYLDGLSALFCVNIGHGRADVVQAGADQAKELGFYTNWTFAHPRAIELAARIAELAPGDLNRVFFTSGGSEAVESAHQAVAPVPQGHRQPAQDQDRSPATSPTTARAWARWPPPGSPACARRSSRSPRAASTSPTPTPSAMAHGYTESDLAEAVAEKIEFEGPDTVAAVIMEPVQNAGGCFTPPEGYWQRVREICDEYNVLLISDEVICAWGRLGEWFGAQRYDYEPDLITTAKGLTSAYAPMGAVIASDKVAEPFLEGHNSFTPRVHVRRAPGLLRDRAGQPRRHGERGHHRERPRQRGRVPRDARLAARHPDRRRRARHRLLPRRSSWSRTRTPTLSGPTRSPRRCCAASCRVSCTSAASSAAPTTAATRSSSSRRR